MPKPVYDYFALLGPNSPYGDARFTMDFNAVLNQPPAPPVTLDIPPRPMPGRKTRPSIDPASEWQRP